MSKIHIIVVTFLVFASFVLYFRKWHNGIPSNRVSSENNATSVDTSKVTMRRLISLLAENAATPPLIPVNSSCVPEPLQQATSSICLDQPGLTGRRFKEPRRLILLILFGFEVDVLEIALKQQQDLVDKIFLVESTSTHRGVSKSKIHICPLK